MPLDNRYVVAAFDAQGERIAFLSPSFEWVTSARDATIFQAQIDANYFIKKNDLNNNANSKAPALDQLDHVKTLFVRVEIKTSSPDFDPENPDRGISFSGISG